MKEDCLGKILLVLALAAEAAAGHEEGMPGGGAASPHKGGSSKAR